MSDNLSKEQIIESLFKYLPGLATSVSEIVNILQEINGNNQAVNGKRILDLVEKIGKITETMESVVAEVPISKEIKKPTIDMKEIDIQSLYTIGFIVILRGLSQMMQWLRDESKDEKSLVESIDLLYHGSQCIITLVDVLFENKQE